MGSRRTNQRTHYPNIERKLISSTVQDLDLETSAQLPQRQFWSIPGCEHVFVPQLLHFGPRHGDDNVVDVVHTDSLAFADKPLEGNRVDVKHELVVQLVACCVFN